MYKVIHSGHVLFYDSDENLIVSRKGKIEYKYSDLDGVLPLPINGVFKFLVRFRLLERALRLEPRFGFVIDENTLIFSFHGAMYRANLVESRIEVEKKYRAGMNNPLNICIVNRGNNNELLFGEYWDNPKRDEVAVYFRKETGEWNCIYRFPPKTVKHIHQITYDKYKNRYLIATGDEDCESGIWEANLDFSCVKPILIGKQMYRSCFVVPTDDGFFYATDTPMEQNSVFYVKEDNCVKISKVYDLPGPCIYGKRIGDLIILSTSVEPDYNKPKWVSRFSRKIGPGIKEPYVYIIIGNKNLVFKEIERFKKDWHSMWVFQLGNVCFSGGDSEKVIATGIALNGIDGKSIEISTDKGVYND